MTPSKLTDAVERARDQLFQEAQLGMSKAAADDFVRLFASDLILAVREITSNHKINAEGLEAISGSYSTKGAIAAYDNILHSLDAFLGDNE